MGGSISGRVQLAAPVGARQYGAAVEASPSATVRALGVSVGCSSENRSSVPVLALSLSNFELKIQLKKIQFKIGPGQREMSWGSV